jgi:type IV secretory pathway VirB4 component
MSEAKTQNSVKEGKKGKAESTQTHLKIAEIHDGTVVLKNGGLRAVLKTSSVNLNLKSEEEQNAVIYSYQNFLNTLEFPIQIVVRSKRLDLENYIEKLKKIGVKQGNPLLQKQTFEYTEYISRLVEYADIMEKQFYVVIPQDPFGQERRGFLKSFLESIFPQDTVSKIQTRQKQFEELKKRLSQRVNTVRSGLENCGLRVEELNTEELIELYYETYNPLTSRSQRIEKGEELALEEDEVPKTDVSTVQAPH